MSLVATVLIWVMNASRGGLLNMSVAERDKHERELMYVLMILRPLIPRQQFFIQTLASRFFSSYLYIFFYDLRTGLKRTWNEKSSSHRAPCLMSLRTISFNRAPISLCAIATFHASELRYFAICHFLLLLTPVFNIDIVLKLLYTKIPEHLVPQASMVYRALR